MDSKISLKKIGTAKYFRINFDELCRFELKLQY